MLTGPHAKVWVLFLLASLLCRKSGGEACYSKPYLIWLTLLGACGPGPGYLQLLNAISNPLQLWAKLIKPLKDQDDEVEQDQHGTHFPGRIL